MNPQSRRGLNLVELLMILGIIGILASILIPITTGCGGAARRSVDASNVRQIGQAALIYANDNGGQLPGLNLNEVGEIVEHATTPNLHAIAAALAGGGTLRDDSWMLNDAMLWISAQDRHPDIIREKLYTVIQSKDPRILSPSFAQSPLSFQFVAGLNNKMPSTTPIAFIRGLQTDGEWGKDRQQSVYGNEGGHIVFLGGNVSFYRNLHQDGGRLKDVNGEPTVNILETIESSQRIFSYPATPTGAVDGTPGIGERGSRAEGFRF